MSSSCWENTDLSAGKSKKLLFAFIGPKPVTVIDMVRQTRLTCENCFLKWSTSTFTRPFMLLTSIFTFLHTKYKKRTYCNLLKFDLEILMNLHVLDLPVFEKTMFGNMSVGL
ncbi:hypothetical protein AVEN_256901-1 [Araneus ventricosus]|uniref:Uncharacterized protein n=1 Tax=Araneus ventricosus TaxID=182803 RepID=A0A4Y2CHY9_ARAVE|nr:hypothetical protein AVEN_256901-1 [Araneus ventricosus]